VNCHRCEISVFGN